MTALLVSKLLLFKHEIGAALLTGVFERVCSFLIKRTESIAANSTGELIAWGFKRLFKKEEKGMQFKKEFDLGQAGKLTISEEAGIASVSVSASMKAGGGALEGVASAQLSASVQVSAKQLIDAGLELAIAKFPAAASILEGAKAAIDAELAKS